MNATTADIKAQGAHEFDQVIRELGACQLTGMVEHGIEGDRHLRLSLPDDRFTLSLQFAMEDSSSGTFFFSIYAPSRDGFVSTVEINAAIESDGVEWSVDSMLNEPTPLEELRQHLRLKSGRDGFPLTAEQSLAAMRAIILFYRDHVPSPILT
jgi:hypothetical protein